MLAELLREYGFLAILVGTFFEGETILVMGGFAAHQGYLSLPVVMLSAFCGSLAGDQVAFFLGREHGLKLIGRFPRLAAGVARATALLERRGTALLIGFRFIYGIRNAVPLAAGLSHISIPRFLALNAIGAALWATSVAAAGYAFGGGFALALERARKFEEHALAVILFVGVTAGVVHLVVRARRRRREPRASSSEGVDKG